MSFPVYQEGVSVLSSLTRGLGGRNMPEQMPLGFRNGVVFSPYSSDAGGHDPDGGGTQGHPGSILKSDSRTNTVIAQEAPANKRLASMRKRLFTAWPASPACGPTIRGESGKKHLMGKKWTMRGHVTYSRSL